jgi:putative sterol carrier protein
VWILKYRAGRWLAQKLLSFNARRYKKSKSSAPKMSKQTRSHDAMNNPAEGMSMSDLNKIFDEMKSRFNSAAAAGMDVVFQYQIDDGEPYNVTVADDSCVVAQGEHDEPSVTLSMDTQTLQEVVSGETDGMQAFMTGRIRADGDIMLATRLAALFPVA